MYSDPYNQLKCSEFEIFPNKQRLDPDVPDLQDNCVHTKLFNN
jgi:hypothetical protein